MYMCGFRVPPANDSGIQLKSAGKLCNELKSPAQKREILRKPRETFLYSNCEISSGRRRPNSVNQLSIRFSIGRGDRLRASRLSLQTSPGRCPRALEGEQL